MVLVGQAINGVEAIAQFRSVAAALPEAQQQLQLGGAEDAGDLGPRCRQSLFPAKIYRAP